MSYSGSANSIISKKSELNSITSNVNNLNFDGVWKSKASQKLLTSLDDVVNKIKVQMANLNTFANAVRRIDELIEIDGKVAELSARLMSIDVDTEDGAAAAAAIQGEISQLEQKKQQIKNEIKGAISGFASISSDYSISYSGVSAANWNELVEMANEFSKLPAGDLIKALTLVDENGNVIRDGEQYVNDEISSIKQRYTGTERNYYVTMKIIELSLEAGVRTPYHHYGTSASGKTVDTRLAVPTDTLSKGIDCNAFASYVIFDKNSNEKWLTVDQFEYAGQGIYSYEEMQSGDIFANGQHVGMIVANNTEIGEAIILHATGTEMRLEKVNYDYFTSKGHSIRRVDSTYMSPEYMDAVGIEGGFTLNPTMGFNQRGPSGSETWYNLNMNNVIENMESEYGFTNLEYIVREDGVKLLSGVDPNGERFDNLIMVAADVYHEHANPGGTFQRGEIVETSLGKGIVVDYCERSVDMRKQDGSVHFDIATNWNKN